MAHLAYVLKDFRPKLAYVLEDLHPVFAYVLEICIIFAIDNQPHKHDKAKFT